jgi:hypothetical protein
MLFFVILLVISSCKKADNNNNLKVKNNIISKNTVVNDDTNKKKDKNNVKFSQKKPIFEKTDEAVDLRYKFKLGEKVNIVHYLEMAVRYNNNLVFINTKLYGYYKINKKIDNKNYQIEWIIKRIVTELKTKDLGGKDKLLKYDSAGQNNNFPNGELLKGIIDKSIKSDIDERGNLSNIDIKSVLSALEDSSQELKLRKEISQKTEQLINISFILLPENKVKIGDKYYGRKDIQDTSMLNMKSNRKYSVDSISKDKRFVLLKPSIDFALDSDSKKQKIDIKKNEMTGWILFDVLEGKLKELYIHTRLSMKINDVKMKMDLKSRFKIIE